MKHEVFLAHNSADQAAAESLAVRLLAQEEIRSWLDAWDLVPGEAWQPAIEEAILRCPAVVACIGAHGFGKVQSQEVQVALNLGFSDPRKRVLVALLPGAPSTPHVPAFLRLRTWVDLRTNSDKEFRRLVAGIRGIPVGSPVVQKPDDDASITVTLVNFSCSRSWCFDVSTDVTGLELVRMFKERVAEEAWESVSVPKPGRGFTVSLYTDDKAAAPLDLLDPLYHSIALHRVLARRSDVTLNVRWSVTFRGSDVQSWS